MPIQQQQQYQHNVSQIATNTNFASSTTGAPTNTPYANLPANGVPPPPLDPGALAQAMAFMSTPAGIQTMNAFANHMAGASAAPLYPQPVPSLASIPQVQSSPPQLSSRKRKRVERAGEWQSSQNTQPGAQKPPRAKAAVPPPVPSFGFSLPVPPTHSTTVTSGRDSNAKRKVNLGLTQLQEESDSSEEEDVDEEASLAANIKVQGIVFEYEGETISLQTAAEIAAWIKDRRRNFPTQKRIAEKAQEAAQKRASELDFLRRVTGKPKKEKKDQLSKRKEGKRHTAPTKPDLEELRQKVKESVLSKQSKPPTLPSTNTKQQAVDLGLGYDTETESDDTSSILSESSAVSSSEESSDESDNDSDDSNVPPEAASSKIAKAPIVPTKPPPPRKKEAPSSSDTKTKMCYQWKETGKCKFGRNCHYSHEIEEPKHIGLYERMVEQELEKADRLALEAIKYLGRHGFLG
ncbi:hypothetical protein N0V90_012584 [Kalmusia sp. IMI 367209]|nr:hypothetical protein N0V90_012584 [Kalmusia sp. IMI 367209]